MKTDTKQRILAIIEAKKQVRVKDLIVDLGLSQVAIQKQLLNLINERKLVKYGRSPLVFYGLAQKQLVVSEWEKDLTSQEKQIIEDNYLRISVQGVKQVGMMGFGLWCDQIGEKKVVNLAREYCQLLTKIQGMRSDSGCFDATDKLKSTFEQLFVDRLVYGDFYSLPKFGKTKLGQLILYAKQSQDFSLIAEIVEHTRNLISKLIEDEKITEIAYIPPTVPRQIQFMKELEKRLGLKLPTIEIVKVFPTSIVVPQKTLTSLEERKENVRLTMFIKEVKPWKKLLLIDNAVGSGATMNEIARKIREQGSGERIVGLGLVGSYKGFDVVREV